MGSTVFRNKCKTKRRFFTGVNTGWIASPRGDILHTIDGGQTWRPQDSGSDSGLDDLDLIDEVTGWAVGSNGTILTYQTDDITGPESVKEYNLSQNFPNPFMSKTYIEFTLKQSSVVFITVYNILEQVVAKLVNQQMNAGDHTIWFDGSGLASGLYIYEIKTDFFTDSREMLLVK